MSKAEYNAIKHDYRHYDRARACCREGGMASREFARKQLAALRKLPDVAVRVSAKVDGELMGGNAPKTAVIKALESIC